jgi:hypothetical protein
MTGQLVINLTTGFYGLKLVNTMSGNIIHAEKNLTSSGFILSNGNITTRGTFSGSALKIWGTGNSTFSGSVIIESLLSGKPFKGLLTGVVGIVLCKKTCNLQSAIDCTYEKKIFKRNGISFQKNPKSIFNISCTADDAEVIEHIYSIPHITLSGRAKWGLGIVTGNNRKYAESKETKPIAHHSFFANFSFLKARIKNGAIKTNPMMCSKNTIVIGGKE